MPKINTKKRSVTVATVNKWKTDQLAETFPNSWLKVNQKDGIVLEFSCRTCQMFVSRIKQMKEFRQEFITGSKNQRLSSLKDHAYSCCHKLSYELFCRQDANNANANVNTDDQTDCDHSIIDMPSTSRPSSSASGSRTNTDKNQRTIGDCFSGLSDKVRTQMCKKMEIAFFVGKNELPFTMCEAIVELESKHGVDLGVAYTNRKQCSEFVDLHGDHIRQNLTADLKKAKIVYDLSSCSNIV